ncbi:MAG TPA: class I SAM-dependent methyltransferase [Spirochaetia bacterium]|nr:class I SAM-dependent methyltransferase [Spirochaetia bacterium]
MKTNWPERVWVNGPLRIFFQQNEVKFFRSLHEPEHLQKVLEVGCGNGIGVNLILRAFGPEVVEAIDIDPLMVRKAERRFAKRAHNGTTVKVQVGDAEQLPYGDGSMDAVFNFGIIHHLEDWDRGIREISRVLKPGGVFYFEEIYPDLYANFLLRYLLVHPRENRFRGPEYRAALERAGLHLIEGYHETRYTILGAALKSAAG